MNTLRTLGHELFDTPSRLCQFRMFFEFARPHIWTDAEFFLGGNIESVSGETIEELDLTRGEAIGYMNQLEQRLFFGPASTPAK